jgi:type IV pilus assembly protein PilC
VCKYRQYVPHAWRNRRRGCGINKALPFAADACGNRIFQRAVNGLVSQLENGSRLQDAMTAESCFPLTLQRMIRLGEESGKLEHMLQQSTEFHEEKLRRTVSSLLPLIEPLLMVLLGFVVGGLILAMYLPIFAMGDLFHS